MPHTCWAALQLLSWLLCCRIVLRTRLLQVCNPSKQTRARAAWPSGQHSRWLIDRSTVNDIDSTSAAGKQGSIQSPIGTGTTRSQYKAPVLNSNLYKAPAEWDHPVHRNGHNKHSVQGPSSSRQTCQQSGDLIKCASLACATCAIFHLAFRIPHPGAWQKK